MFGTNDKRHTPGHYDCPACEYADMLLNLDSAQLSYLPFSQAADLWMELRRRKSLRPRTHESTRGYLDALHKFFGEMRLNKITAGSVREYQLARAVNMVEVEGRGRAALWQRPAGNSLINHEVCVLGQMLAHAKLWGAIKANYTPLRVSKWSPREVLSEEEEEHLFTVARDSPEAHLAYWVALITNNTTAAGCELRGLRLKHLFLREPKLRDGIDTDPSEIYIPHDAVKNESRPRKIALNTTAKWAIEQCYKRALRLGSCQPDHYLFPFRVKKNTYDPTRPPSRWWLRDSWKKMQASSGLTALKPHDLRHQCITRMLERGVDPETVRAIAGHVTEEMMHYYSHIRRQAKYAAVMAIEPTSSIPRKTPSRESADRRGNYAQR